MRLTKKDRYGHFYTNEASCRNIYSLDGKKLEGEFFEDQTLAIDGNAIDKLGRLEDYEDELEVDLKIKLKVEAYYMRNYKDLKATAVVKGRDGKLITVNLYHFFPTCVKVLYPEDKYGDGDLLYKDYGITWALTKEEFGK